MIKFRTKAYTKALLIREIKRLHPWDFSNKERFFDVLSPIKGEKSAKAYFLSKYVKPLNLKEVFYNNTEKWQKCVTRRNKILRALGFIGNV